MRSGGLNFGTLVATNSTISGNSSDLDGGGMHNFGSATLTNSTVSGNSVRRREDGNGGFGGGVSNARPGRLMLTDSTISGNSAADKGGGVYNFCGTVTLTQTLVSGNLSADLGPEVRSSRPSVECSPAIYADASNLFGHTGYSGVSGFTPGTTDIVPTVPLTTLLDPALGSNGGPTATHALVNGSPAVDAVPAAACATPTDQRGFTRPHDGDGNTVADCDIGAFELGAVPPSPPPPPPSPPPPPPSVAPPPDPRAAATCRARAGCGVMLSCQDTSASCMSQVRVTVRARALNPPAPRASAMAPRRIRFAASVVNVPPGETGRVQLQLTKRGRNFVRRNPGTRLRGRLEISNAIGGLISNTPITLRLR